MITLSFSTINNCLQPENSHNWLNKQMGIQVPDNQYFRDGKRDHTIIQQHLSGKKIDPRLVHIDYTFPIVEEVDFDPRCEFFYPITNGFQIHGFCDALDPQNLRFAEIKTSGTMWTVGQFKRSIQLKIYALAHPQFKEAIGITALLDESQWDAVKPKVYKIPLTDRDRVEASKFILDGISVLQKGDFKGGLNEEGKCTDYRCYYGENCQFK